MSISAPVRSASSSSAAAPRRSPSPGSPPSTSRTIAVAVARWNRSAAELSGIRPAKVARRLEVADDERRPHPRAARRVRVLGMPRQPRLGLTRRRRHASVAERLASNAGGASRDGEDGLQHPPLAWDEIRRDEGGAGHDAEGERARRRSAERVGAVEAEVAIEEPRRERRAEADDGGDAEMELEVAVHRHGDGHRASVCRQPRGVSRPLAERPPGAPPRARQPHRGSRAIGARAR